MANMTTPVQAAPFAPSADDLEGIKRAGVDYIESWYAGDAERMKACLHPELAKRSVAKDPAHDVMLLRTTSAHRMYQLTKQGEGTSTPESEKKHEVTILDASPNIASLKVVSYEFIDYLHVARFEERWLIVNVLWDERQPVHS